MAAAVGHGRRGEEQSESTRHSPTNASAHSGGACLGARGSAARKGKAPLRGERPWPGCRDGGDTSAARSGCPSATEVGAFPIRCRDRPRGVWAVLLQGDAAGAISQASAQPQRQSGLTSRSWTMVHSIDHGLAPHAEPDDAGRAGAADAVALHHRRAAASADRRQEAFVGGAGGGLTCRIESAQVCD
jgi:hypothetical protein